MKFAAATAILSVTAASAYTVEWDPGYGDGSRSMTAVACSNGQNGLITKYGFNTQSDIPSFPYIGASDTIPGWNSPNCGQCLEITSNGKTIHMLAIDHADTGIVTSQAAVDDLTGGQAVQLGAVEATVTPVDVSLCGLTPKKLRRTFEA